MLFNETLEDIMEENLKTNSNPDEIAKLILHIRQQVPAGFVSREQIESLTYGLLKSRFLANIDCDPKKKGIAGRRKAGKIIVYPISELENFLRNQYIKPASKKVKSK